MMNLFLFTAVNNNNNNNVLNNNNLNGSPEGLCTNRCEQPDPDFIKMFVGQVPKSMDEDQLREMFEEFGRVHSINVLRDKVTGVSKGNWIRIFFVIPHPILAAFCTPLQSFTFFLCLLLLRFVFSLSLSFFPSGFHAYNFSFFHSWQ